MSEEIAMSPSAVTIPYADRRLAPVERVNREAVAVAASFEFFPPKTDELARALEDTADRLRPLDPAFVSVTYGAGGSTRERTHETVIDLARRGFRVAAHLTCVGQSAADVRAIVKRYRHAGVRHVVALRGDLPGQGGVGGSLPHAADLVRVVRRCEIEQVTVGAFPEGHPESGFSLTAEIENLKRKVDAGATDAITQFTFDNAVYLRFLDRARAAGIEIPIVPGILPITNVAQTRRFAAQVGASVPPWLDGLFAGLDDDPATRDLVAASVAAEQCADLATHGIRHVHFYTLNRAALTYAVCRLLGITASRPAA
jgi:methylenetetrahydrofolate reductase (NADPH)